MYNIFTQWLTLSVIFFLTAYNTSWLEVVTLGGLIMGAGIIAVWSIITAAVTGRLSFYWGLLVLMAGTAAGIYFLAAGLPGYELHAGAAFIAFIVLWSIFVKWQYRFLQRRN